MAKRNTPKEILGGNGDVFLGCQHTPAGALGRLFRNILRERGVNLITWNSLMIKFLLDQSGRRDTSAPSLSTERGNFTKLFLDGEMSWKTFIKAMQFMRYHKLRITILADCDDGRSYEHSLTLNIGRKRGTNDEQESSEEATDGTEQ